MTLVKYPCDGYLLALIVTCIRATFIAHISFSSWQLRAVSQHAAPGSVYPGRIYLFESKGILKRVLIERAQRVDARTAVDPEQSAPRLCLHWSHAK